MVHHLLLECISVTAKDGTSRGEFKAAESVQTSTEPYLPGSSVIFWRSFTTHGLLEPSTHHSMFAS